MSTEGFVSELEKEVQREIDRLGEASGAGEAGSGLSVEKLLVVALKNELEAAEIAAVWMPSTDELEVKLTLARQAGDEAKHYRLIAQRLNEMGVDADTIDPRQSGYSAMFAYLHAIQSTAARVAAGQFAREGIAVVRNVYFISYCRSLGDNKTASLYEEVIQPDEKHHHETGRKLLSRYATTTEAQKEARAAALGAIRIAEEIQEMARLKLGISRAPGC